MIEQAEQRRQRLPSSKPSFELLLQRVEDGRQHRGPEHGLDEVQGQPEKRQRDDAEQDQEPRALDRLILHRDLQG